MTWEVEVAVNRDRTIALHLGQQEQNSDSKKKMLICKKSSLHFKALKAVYCADGYVQEIDLGCNVFFSLICSLPLFLIFNLSIFFLTAFGFCVLHSEAFPIPEI